MLVIKPDECIDCGVCEPECPIQAIEPDTNENANKWIEMNTKYSEIWPNISKKRKEDVPTVLKVTVNRAENIRLLVDF